ncbi:phosphoserine phosphatase SerB [Candidimonas sp. SYP-B2681]|uniref:phosphoserine phosphatase SerB n=1 Tax=Candidimonas sp. SYP-B2681 TaxID=2497686 RepID=UPI000F890B41|nr:phosphoserine phosphatase SerB [Candidimonas sp. SYP-B2681]RTZ42444.1 phosphoserine phosphatase SerB [Candidimonas sp. SYP-B2681]
MTHLILQAPNLNAANIEKIAAIANADGVQELGSTAVRLLNVESAERPAVEQCCNDFGMDYAFFEQIARLRDCKILAMDMDSTLVNIECIDEIADMVGRKAEVAAITEAAMRGEITDFAQSLTRRVALLEGVPVSALEQVYDERLRLNPGAEKLISIAKKHGMQTLLVSGGFTFFTQRLQERLGLDDAHANVLETSNGKLTGHVCGPIVDAQGKADHLRALADRLGATPDQIIAVGDGANDLTMMALAQYSVAYRAKPVVRAQANYALNVSPLDAILNWFRLSH